MTIDELFEKAKLDELEKEIEAGLKKLEKEIELPTGEKITIDEIELKELEKLPFGAIY